MKYIREFNTLEELEMAENQLNFPNISLCKQDANVHFKPYVSPNKIITYKATKKLKEIQNNNSTAEGLHVNSFNTTIKTHTFKNKQGIIEFNDIVTIIGIKAFNKCSTLTEINIPNTVTEIKPNAFNNCKQLQIVNFNDKTQLNIIHDNAFENCINLKTIKLPNTLKIIKDYAFQNCNNITQIELGENITHINYAAFNDCNKLNKIIIKTIIPPIIGINAFHNTNNANIYVPNKDTYINANGWNNYKDRIKELE